MTSQTCSSAPSTSPVCPPNCRIASRASTSADEQQQEQGDVAPVGPKASSRANDAEQQAAMTLANGG